MSNQCSLKLKSFSQQLSSQDFLPLIRFYSNMNYLFYYGLFIVISKYYLLIFFCFFFLTCIICKIFRTNKRLTDCFVLIYTSIKENWRQYFILWISPFSFFIFYLLSRIENFRKTGDLFPHNGILHNMTERPSSSCAINNSCGLRLTRKKLPV